MSLHFFLFAVVLAVIVCGFLYPVKTLLRIRLRPPLCYIDIRMHAFYNLIPVRFRLRIDFKRLDEIRIIWIRNNGRTYVLYHVFPTVKKFKHYLREIFFSYPPKLLVRDFYFYGSVGIADDAFATVMLTGFIQIFLNTYGKYKIMDFKERSAIIPNFYNNVFRLNLNLEGILSVRTAQIIIAVIKQQLTQKREVKNSVSSNRKHNENNYGRNFSDGGR